MSKIMVPYTTLDSAYPKTKDRVEFLKEIFPNLSKEQINALYPNACCFRISYALNVAGLRVTREAGLAQVKGSIAGREYYFVINCLSMDNYLRKKGYEPKVWVLEHDMPRYLNKAVKDLSSLKGIIYFDFRGSPGMKSYGGRATYSGHFDLWNGSATKTGEYFDDYKTKRILLWECSS